MVIRSGAALPAKCFVSGKQTKSSVAITEYWQPKWVFLLLLPGLLPYFLISPFVCRSISLNVPITENLRRKHIRSVNVGFALTAFGTLMAIAGGVSGSLILVVQLLLPIGILLALVGFFISSRQPVSIRIVELSGEFLVLQNVHPACLESLPDFPHASTT